MPRRDEFDKHSKMQDDGDTGTGGTGTGGKSGQVEFREFISSGGETRDDLLTGEEKKRLLSVHKDIHESNVKKQKSLRERRQDVKNGKITLDQYRQEKQPGSQFKANPILRDKAQFSGQDPQVNSLPDQNIADTNEADRNELEFALRLRNAPQSAPRFNPKPLR